MQKFTRYIQRDLRLFSIFALLTDVLCSVRHRQ